MNVVYREDIGECATEKTLFLEPAVEEDGEGRTKSSASVTLRRWSWVAQGLFFLVSLSLFTVGIQQNRRDSNCVRKHSKFSPALDVIDDDYKEWRFNGTLDHPSPYKGPPSDEVDARWRAITKLPLISVSLDTIRKIGASEDSVRLPPESGGGYMAELEVFHQLHCLNLLWQGTHADYYSNRSEAWRDPPELLRTHMDHCLDILRQKLMCDADAGILTFNWVKGYARPYENFNTLHKCRDFDGLVAWNRRHMAPRAHTDDGYPRRDADSVELDLPP